MEDFLYQFDSYITRL